MVKKPVFGSLAPTLDIPKRKRGRPRKNRLLAVVDLQPKRPRGRPRKNYSAAVENVRKLVEKNHSKVGGRISTAKTARIVVAMMGTDPDDTRFEGRVKYIQDKVSCEKKEK